MKDQNIHLPVRVYSHSRSGTNWLLASLYRNFRFPELDGPYTTEKVAPAEHVWTPLHGSHCLPTRRCVPNYYLYLWRDGRDVMVSLWRWKNSHVPSIQGISFSDFLRLRDGSAFKNFSVNPNTGPIEHWLEHVESWLSTNIFAISYDDLMERPIETLSTIEYHFCLSRRDPECPLSVESAVVGYNPGKAHSGQWRNYFSDSDLEYYHSIVSRELHLRTCIGSFPQYDAAPNTFAFRKRKRNEASLP